MKYSYVIIDDDPRSVLKTQAMASGFQQLQYLGAAHTYDEGLDLILEHQPAVVFLEIQPEDTSSRLSLSLINELHRYLKQVPKIIITTFDKALAFEAIKYEVLDYCVKPVAAGDLRKALLRLQKSTSEPQTIPVPQPAVAHVPVSTTGVAGYPFIVDLPIEASDVPENSGDIDSRTEEHFSDPGSALIGTIVNAEPQGAFTEVEEQTPPEAAKDEKPLIICVKSYGDYRFIEAGDICYLQADNNSTDIHLYNGEMITAFKTLKHFENVLSSPFVRIHNSYIVNIDYVSRIHTGNSVCYIKGTTTKLPFSKSYKENVDAIINSITNGNYLEI